MWDRTFQLRSGAGFNDNLTLSSVGRERSYSLNNAIEFTLFRLPLDGRQFTLFLSAEDTRYPDGQQVNHEDYVVALARYKADVSPAWNLGVDGQYFFQDQVIDTSITETNPTPTRVQGHNLRLRPSARRELPGRFWVEVSADGLRQFFKEPLDDYTEGGLRFSVGRDYGFKSEASISCQWRRRAYDTREQLTVDGVAIPGTSLEFTERTIESMLRHTFDAPRRWRASARLGAMWNTDNGPGYFDYIRYQSSIELRHVQRDWEIKATARLAHYEFTRQRVSPGDSTRRRKELVAVSLKAERKLAGSLKLFAEYSRETSGAPRSTDEFEANRLVAGIDWEFLGE